MIAVQVRIEQRGLTWEVKVGERVVASGLTKPEALKERWRHWCTQPEQRGTARERINGG